MRLSENTLARLALMITGDSQESPPRSGPKIVNFFNVLGIECTYERGFPPRAMFTVQKLNDLNGTSKMEEAIIAAFSFWDDWGFDCAQQGALFNNLFARDGYRLSKQTMPGWIEDGRQVAGPPYFVVRPLSSDTLGVTALIDFDQVRLPEHIKKCRDKIAAGDFSGAITNAYTLMEALLKDLLRKTETPYKPDEGDIRQLYNLLKEPLNLDPKGESLEGYLKTILDGFQKIVSGLYFVSNKGSDRHDRRHDPAPHHAKLVVNSAFALGEFLCDTFEYQRERRAGEKLDV